MIRIFFFFSSRRRHTRSLRDWSSDVCSSDLGWSTTLTKAGLTWTLYGNPTITYFLKGGGEQIGTTGFVLNSVVRDPLNTSHILLAGRSGAWGSPDNGAHSYPFNRGLNGSDCPNIPSPTSKNNGSGINATQCSDTDWKGQGTTSGDYWMTSDSIIP